jgi:diguanylate cyclase (GGDEF)-like protein
VLLAVGAFALIAAVTLDQVAAVGVAQTGMIALLFTLGAVVCWRAPMRGLGWLGFGFAMRASLAMLEAAAYGSQLFDPGGDQPRAIGVFLAAHSLFDGGAEWAITLGCVLAMAHRSHSELERTHAELTRAHRELQEIAERDPLTGLANRRMLSSLLTRVAHRDGWLLFFDLDGFKRINDNDGHVIGDACLRRFGVALRETFDPDDAIVRYAGDEFVVATRQHPEQELQQRLAGLREQLGNPEGDTPGVRFSVGYAPLPVGGDAQRSLREADAAMYRDKARASAGA